MLTVKLGLADGSVVARAKMDLKAQFTSDASMDTFISETPVYNVYTMASSTGAGAAIAEMSDIGLGFNLAVGSHLGNFLFEKTDIFFFSAIGDSEYVNKSITTAIYKGGRTANATTMNDIEGYLDLSDTYYDDTCNDTTTDCDTMFTALFSDPDFGGQEQNSGADPGDARSTTINAVTSTSYLSSVYPTGSTTWDSVFDMTFTP